MLKPLLGRQLNYADPLAQGLVGAWLFNEGSGNRVYDLSGNGNTGVLTNMDPATDWVPGPDGAAVDFDGSDDLIAVPRTLGTAFTIVALVNPTNLTTHRTIVGASSSTNGYQFRIDTNGKLVLNKQDIAALATSTGTVSAGAWSVLGVTHTVDKVIRFYIGGVDVGGGTHTQTITETGVWLGNRKFFEPIYVERFLGQMAVAYQYNRALSAAEVADLYVNPYRMFAPSGLPLWMMTAEAAELVGEMIAELTAAGTLTRERALTGNVVAELTVAGELTRSRALVASLVAELTAAGTLTRTRALAGEALMALVAEGDLQRARALAGEVLAELTGAGTLSRGRYLSGEVLAELVGAGELTRRRQLVGEVLAELIGSGTLTLTGAGGVALVGEMVATLVASGTLTRTRELAGAALVELLAEAILTREYVGGVAPIALSGISRTGLGASGLVRIGLGAVELERSGIGADIDDD